MDVVVATTRPVVALNACTVAPANGPLVALTTPDRANEALRTKVDVAVAPVLPATSVARTRKV